VFLEREKGNDDLFLKFFKLEGLSVEYERKVSIKKFEGPELDFRFLMTERNFNKMQSE